MLPNINNKPAPKKHLLKKLGLIVLGLVLLASLSAGIFFAVKLYQKMQRASRQTVVSCTQLVAPKLQTTTMTSAKLTDQFPSDHAMSGKVSVFHSETFVYHLTFANGQTKNLSLIVNRGADAPGVAFLNNKQLVTVNIRARFAVVLKDKDNRLHVIDTTHKIKLGDKLTSDQRFNASDYQQGDDNKDALADSLDDACSKQDQVELLRHYVDTP